MGSSRKQKAENHDRIVDYAAKAVRRAGLKGVSIGEAMNAAGLTHGGFYSHFPTREVLEAEALERAFDHARDSLLGNAGTGDGDGDLFEALVGIYLSERHRSDRGAGCVLPSLSGDIESADPSVREVYDRRFRQYTSRIIAAAGIDGAEGKEFALGALSTMVGAIVLSRALSSPAQSREVLSAATTLLREARERKREEAKPSAPRIEE